MLSPSLAAPLSGVDVVVEEVEVGRAGGGRRLWRGNSSRGLLRLVDSVIAVEA